MIQRNGFSLHRTSFCQARQQTSWRSLLLFSNMCSDLKTNLLSQIRNAEEMPVFSEMLPSYTVDDRVKCLVIKTLGYDVCNCHVGGISRQ
jgi:hypothetical protein